VANPNMFGQAMEMRPASYVVLGMLSVGARSGYEVKGLMDRSARFFWALSPIQVYPELKRLEDAGLIRGREEPRGGRSRRLYRVTAKGQRTLRDWLLQPEDLTIEWRDKGLLKLFFADALDREQAQTVIESIRARSERLAAEFRERIQPVAEIAREREGKEFAALTARFGLEFNEWVMGWCDRVAEDLSHSGRRARPGSPRPRSARR
jgi:PadR family transcriptional regulator, regulatory protein AphA